jgi:hypothetical protein
MDRQPNLALRVCLFVVVGLLLAPRAICADIKLFMKDGSYQLVSRFEVRGDRVRYYSVERSDWEFVPASLVDFDATRRAQEDEKAAQKKELQEAKEIAAERLERPEEKGFEIAPGVRLPPEEGIYTYDGLRVIRLIQSSAEMVTDKKRAALVGAMPLLKGRALVVLDGEKAAVRVPDPQATFYIQAKDDWGARLVLISVKQGKEHRVVEKVEGRSGSAKTAELRATLTLERAQIAPGIYKLKPSQTLAPGEYAFGELLQEKLNLELWDFGIDIPGGK